MTTFDPSARRLNLINTFTVEPEKAHALLTNLSNATKNVFRHTPGFVSASLHLSDDRRHVANYAQWRSKNDYAEARNDPEVQSHMRDAAALASSFEPISYDLIEVHTAERDA